MTDSAHGGHSGQRAPVATGFADSNLDTYRDAPGAIDAPATPASAAAVPRTSSPSSSPSFPASPPGNAPSLHVFLMRMLDEIDYGMVLLDHQSHIWHANHLARAELGKGQLLHTEAGRLCTRVPGKQADLQQAISRAGQGTRSMLDLRIKSTEPHGTNAGATANTNTGTSLAIVPMGHGVEALNGPLPVLIITSRQVLCEDISLQFFAKSFGLTGAERAILSALVQGQEVDEIAESRQLALSTVRTQIKQLRTKTQSNSIRELMGKVSTLPPVVSSIKAF